MFTCHMCVSIKHLRSNVLAHRPPRKVQTGILVPKQVGLVISELKTNKKMISGELITKNKIKT